MDLTPLLSTVAGPYGPLIGVALVVAYSLARQKWAWLPALPLIHTDPAPAPATPAPAPVAPAAPAGPTPPADPSAAPAFPLLSKIFGPGFQPGAIPAAVLTAVRDEILSAISSKLATHQSEAATLAGPAPSTPATPTAGK